MKNNIHDEKCVWNKKTVDLYGKMIYNFNNDSKGAVG